MANSKALDRSVSRTLAAPHSSDSGESRRKRLGRAEKKSRHVHRKSVKEQRAAIATDAKTNKDSQKRPKKTVKKKTKSAEDTEIDNLKKEIIKELNTQEAYVKRQYRTNLPSWEGLTPGSAPIGYDPDESDDNDDPY